ncbi:GNAT family N-acetyltransferase [Halapricum hydrolyticum]|uniref:N-acetyltransferase domain-containing protein n=1 Tax=Halapricum hydrolyticum TaxID=2979991 RepID=A0AAE3IA15_9EURY|nr:hypothetical protein [Halapricum hydrolyticum]MCU4717412.1 hypothetical protein [Halapricum hydrolyticum]MCU4726576.1 hypothetical protein [Halapricum hydrolyticum]
MEVRDAVESDAGRLAELTDAPGDVMRNLIHDRTVRVAENDDEIVGFVSFDARERTVHVTQIEGSSEACTQLLDEPMGFAAGENMAVELLVPESNDTVRRAVEGAGFERDGTGPTFDGTPTVRFRYEPS